jgi:hypothetical protein
MTEVIQFRKAESVEFHEESAAEVLRKHVWQIALVLLIGVGVHLLFFGDYYFTFDDAYSMRGISRAATDSASIPGRHHMRRPRC